MVLKGQIWKEGSHWLIEVPLLDVMTQGRTKKEALEMIVDAIQCLVDEKSFQVVVKALGRSEVVVTCSDLNTLKALLLRQNRHKYGLSLEDMRKRLGVASRNAYAQYEQGKKVPTWDKLLEFLQVMSTEHQIAWSTLPSERIEAA